MVVEVVLVVDVVEVVEVEVVVDEVVVVSGAGMDSYPPVTAQYATIRMATTTSAFKTLLPFPEVSPE